MKKGLLLGLLALSTVAMANTNQNTTSVEVETKLELISNSIVITPEETGDVDATANSILIDHGQHEAAAIANGKTLTKAAEAPVYVRTTTGTLPEGTKVSLTLNANNTNNNLTNGTDTIAHTLNGTISNVEEVDQKLAIGGESVNDNKLVTQAADSPIKIEMTSTVQSDELKGKTQGSYSNTSLLSVQVMAN